MDTQQRARQFIWPGLMASAALAAQTTPLAPVDMDDPDFNPSDPRYRTLVSEELRPLRPPIPVIKTPLGNAYSVRENQATIELTYGEEPALGETLGMRVNRLAVESTVVELTVGEVFELDQLTVKAYGATGELVEHAPLTIELEGPEGFLDLEGFQIDSKTLRTRTRGIGRLWVTSVLPALLTEPFSLPVVLIVRDPGRPDFSLSSRVYENVPASPP